MAEAVGQRWRRAFTAFGSQVKDILDPDLLQDIAEADARSSPTTLDVTPPALQASNDAPTLYQRVITAKEDTLGKVHAARLLPCFPNLPCSFQPGCCTTRTTWVPPDINIRSIPTRILEATIHIHWSNPRIEGAIVTGFENKSTEGKRVEQTTCRCTGGSTQRRESPVTGSATVSKRGQHRHTWQDLQDLVIEGFGDILNEVKPQVSNASRADFVKEGWWSVIRAIWSKVLGWVFHKPASFRVTVHLEDTVTWQWLGEQKTKVFATDVPGCILPVDPGDLNVRLG